VQNKPRKRNLAYDLVGVELHPGPKNKGLSRSKRLAQSGRVKALSGPISTAYIEMLGDPLNSAPIPSGFMTWSDTVCCTPYVKGNTSIVADGLVFVVNPDACLSASGNTTGILDNFLTLNFFNNTTPGGVGSYAAANRGNCTSTVATNRVLASALKINISHAATAQSGTIAVARLNGIVSNGFLDGLTPQFYYSLPQAKIYTTEDGNATIQCNWLPSDASDFEFAKNSVYNNSEGIYNPYVIALSGFPANTRVFFDLVTQIEGQIGTNISGTEIGDEKAGPARQNPSYQPALIDEHSSPEQFMRRSAAIISDVSDKMQYSTEKPNEISDIVSKSYNLFDKIDAGISKAASLIEKANRFGLRVAKYL